MWLILLSSGAWRQPGHHRWTSSALISGGASVKQVQAFLGHASAVITLRTYVHMWPGDQDRTRNVLDAALAVLEHNPKIIRTVDGQ